MTCACVRICAMVSGIVPRDTVYILVAWHVYRWMPAGWIDRNRVTCATLFCCLTVFGENRIIMIMHTFMNYGTLTCYPMVSTMPNKNTDNKQHKIAISLVSRFCYGKHHSYVYATSIYASITIWQWHCTVASGMPRRSVWKLYEFIYMEYGLYARGESKSLPYCLGEKGSCICMRIHGWFSIHLHTLHSQTIHSFLYIYTHIWI